MQKKALLKTSIREIKNSPGRFLSILGIIFLGVAFFVGIGATGPDMLRASNNYYKETQLADLTLYSSLGFSKEDQKLTEKADFVESATLQYLFDIYLSDKNQVFRLMNYESNNPSNQLTLIDGKFPQEKNEILLDNNAAIGQKYKIGDSFDILLKDDPDEQLKEHRFKIVGFVNTSEFIDQTKRGNTNVGNGSIDYFAFLPTEAFNMDAYGRMLIRFRNLNDQAAYTATYDELMVKNETQLKQLLAPRKKERLKEIQEKALKELLANQKKIDDANEQITDGKKQLADAKEQLESGEVELATNQSKFDLEIERAQTEISSQEKQLILAQEELDQQKKMLEEKQRELDVNKGKVEALTEQLTQLNLQKEQLEAVLQQLQESMVLYQEMMQYANQLANLSPEEKVVALEGLKSYLVLLGQTLPTTSELQNLITLLLDGLTVENLDLAIEQLKQLEKLMNEQYIQAQTTISQLEVQMNELANAKETLEAGQAQIDAGRVELETAQAQIKSGQTQLAQGKLDLALEKQKGQQQLTTAKSDLAEGRALYETNLAEFEKLKNEKLPELEKAQKKLNQEREKVMALKAAEYTLVNRDSNPGYIEYKQNANRITSIATVFPTIFFLIAALVSLTTMSRMIEEKRVEIGTYKALGYRNREVALKFLIYALAAGVSGTFLGLAFGFYIFPMIIINAYGQLYSITEFSTPWYWSYSLIGLVVGLFCTVGISLIVLRVDLRSTPATLLRPKAPKAGKRILIERITFIWRRLNFNQKVTMRNLFRYKARMLMTIFGIAGCTAMILTGYGLKNSIGDIVPIQFSQIWTYQGIVSFDKEATEEQTRAYQTTLEKFSHLEATLALASEVFTAEKKGQNMQDVTVYVPENPAILPQFFLMNDRKSGNTYELTDEGAVINEKLAKILNVSIGQSIELKNADKEVFKIKVAAIVENYVGHFAYLTPKSYETIFGKAPQYNSELLLFEESLTKSEEKKAANSLMALDKVVNVTFLSDSSTALDDTTNVLNIVVWVLIISAGLLAFIVLYNLNNINISERIRELSTIKVLGFYNKEVTMYIYRENIILTIFGIGFGLFFGKILHRYVLQTVELDMLMFSPTIHLTSYVFASLITIFFTIVVGIVMYYKLKNVDMIEALKSNE